MKVSTGFHSHAYQQQKSNTKHKGFADMLADMAANKSGKHEKANDGGYRTSHSGNDFLRMGRCSPMSIGFDADGNAIFPCRTGCKSVYKAVEKPKLPELIESKPFVADPKYPKSIWDIPPSEIETEIGNANRACSYIDAEGLTKGEIYNRIESIYKDYLGEDFETQWNLWSCAMNGGGPGSQGYGFFLAQTNFESQLIKFDVGRGNTEVIREARGYSGMSETEMRAAVREKYPKNMTLKDCILMGQEMWKLGLTDGNTGYCVQHYLKTSLGVNWNPPIYGPMSEADRNAFDSAFKRLYTAMLNMPADFESIEALSEEYNKNGFTFRISESMDDLLNKMLSCFGSGVHSDKILSKLMEILDDMEKNSGLTFADTDTYLSQTQVEALSGKYDVNNLSKEDEKALLDDLEEMGIISKEENQKVYFRMAKIPPDWMHGGLRPSNQYWTADGGGNLISSDIPYPTYYTSASREMSLYDYLQSMISDENRLYNEGKEKYGEDGVAYMTDLMQTHQKLLDVLEQIKAGSAEKGNSNESNEQL